MKKYQTILLSLASVALLSGCENVQKISTSGKINVEDIAASLDAAGFASEIRYNKDSTNFKLQIYQKESGMVYDLLNLTPTNGKYNIDTDPCYSDHSIVSIPSLAYISQDKDEIIAGQQRQIDSLTNENAKKDAKINNLENVRTKIANIETKTSVIDQKVTKLGQGEPTP